MASAIGSLAAPVWALAYTMPSSEFSSFGAVVAPEVKDTIGPVAQWFGPVKTVGSKPNTSVYTARVPAAVDVLDLLEGQVHWVLEVRRCGVPAGHGVRADQHVHPVEGIGVVVEVRGGWVTAFGAPAWERFGVGGRR